MKRKENYRPRSIGRIFTVTFITLILIMAIAIGYPVFTNWYMSVRRATNELAGTLNYRTNEKIDVVIVLEVPEAEIMTRLEKRSRMEDTPETIAKRMNIYRQKMYPVLGIFAEAGVKIIHLDGTGTAGEVHDKIFDEVAGSCQV